MTDPIDQTAQPMDRASQLEAARADLRYANQNKLSYEELANRVNALIGTTWDKGYMRRIILQADSTVRGTVMANRLSAEQVSTLRQFAAQLRADIDADLARPFVGPLPSRDFYHVARGPLTVRLSKTDNDLLDQNPKLVALVENAISLTAKQLIEAYKLGQDSNKVSDAPAQGDPPDCHPT